jgi:hypothetical protein
VYVLSFNLALMLVLIPRFRVAFLCLSWIIYSLPLLVPVLYNYVYSCAFHVEFQIFKSLTFIMFVRYFI